MASAETRLGDLSNRAPIVYQVQGVCLTRTLGNRMCSFKAHGLFRLECTACMPHLFEGWSKPEGCEELHLRMNGSSLNCHISCLGSPLSMNSPETDGVSLVPSTVALLKERYPDKCARDFLPSTTILYMGPGGHKQWPKRNHMPCWRSFSFVMHHETGCNESFEGSTAETPVLEAPLSCKGRQGSENSAVSAFQVP